jgi:hypothetical protein
MRGYWSIVALSVLAGMLASWSLWDAAEQYSSALRTYRQLEVTYQPGSFRWLAADFGQARVTLTIANHSPADATIESLDVELLFDGAFAGSNYGGFRPLAVPRGESRVVEVELTVTAGSLQPGGGTAALSLGGAVVSRFEGIRRAIALDVGATIGTVAQ